MPAGLTYIALLHFPVYDRNGKVVATAITNLDIHDLARSTRTFGLAGYYVVTPLERQRELATRIVGYWNEEEGPRAEALKKVRIASELAEVVQAIARAHGCRPRIIATAARERNGTQTTSSAELRRQLGEENEKPALLVFGTGWGLEDALIESCDQVLEPIRGDGDYNHLSVRSAAAIILDRLFGERQ
jgi:hypothetical protein